METPTKKFSDYKIGEKWVAGNIEYKKISAAAAYGSPINKNQKGKKGIYTFN